MSEGPDAGNIIAGIFLIILGLCVTLVGGGCTILWVGLMLNYTGGSGGEDLSSILLMLLSIAVLVAGIGAIVVGVRMFIKR